MALRANEAEFERLYTVEQFEQLPQINDRYDLIDGRLVKRPMTVLGHAAYTGNIRDAYKEYNRTQPTSLGYMAQEASVRLGPRNAPTPDAAFWKPGRLSRGEALNRTAPRPDLAIEVHSPDDLRGKVHIQSAMIKVKKLLEDGVAIVWVVYPDVHRVDVYHSDRGFESGPVISKHMGEELSGEDIIPGFILPVSRIFEVEF